jgi:hypothetical protein
MPTDVISSIGSAGGRDYATLALWEAACPANLVTDDKRWIGECYNDSEFTGTGTILSISGITVDATRYIILRCATGQSFVDNASIRSTALNYSASNGVGIRNTDNTSSNTVFCNVSYTRFIGLQIYHDGTTTGKSLEFQDNNSSGVVDKCIVRTVRNLTGALNATVTNSLFITGDTDGNAILAAVRSAKIYGCTLVSNRGTAANSGIFRGYSATAVTVQNTAVFNVTDFGNNTSGWTCSYNATSAASAPGTNNQTSLTYADQFENSASDYRAKSTGSLDLNGTPDSTNLSTDISGTTRHASTPTIGAWEVVADGQPTIKRMGGVAFAAGGPQFKSGRMVW